MKNLKPSDTGSRPTPKAHIEVTPNGPYLLYGSIPLNQQFIMPDAMGESWYYQRGAEFATNDDPSQPTALCRCGHSRHHPYCDQSHLHAEWDSELTAQPDNLVAEAKFIEGEGVTLSDNERYCCYARFCHPGGSAWRLTMGSSNDANRELAIREASMCPSARLMAWRNGEDVPYEFDFEPSIALLEDPEEECSAGLWLRGGIEVGRTDGVKYEVRNRVVLCRCGASHNKPYCDGSHAAIKWSDNIQGEPVGEMLPEDDI